MRRSSILGASATSLARAIRRREVTSRAVVEAHIARIREVNPTLNAVVRDRFAAALAEADLADEKTPDVHPDDLPLFHGVPCTIKEAFAFAGMPNSAGLWARRNTSPDKDATAVARLRAAGAIPMGITNVSELCMWMESQNRVYGRTNNAYDPKRTAGGSSGGEGSIVGAGGSPFGLGSDVGGSIRMPAFFNGVFGHKSTGGLVPSTGQYPPAHHDVQRYVVNGPLARRAEDLMPVLRVLAGPDGVEENTITMTLGDPAEVDLSRLTVFSVEDNGAFKVAAPLVDAQRRAARALESMGARVETRRIKALSRSLEIWSTMLHEGGRGVVTFCQLMANGGAYRPWRELARMPFGRSRYTLPGVVLSLLEELPSKLPDRSKKVLALGRELQAELESLLGDDGVMLYPTYPDVAPRHNAPLLVPFKWVYTAILNVMEMPSTAVPLGLDRRGLPLGIQVAAARRNDHMTIGVAMALERAFGGWTPPPRWPIE